MSKCVAFLDLLGFSSFVTSEGVDVASSLLESLNVVASFAIYETRKNPANSYENKTLQDIAAKNQLNSFENFLALSDSVFIVSSDANLFIEQLSSFLYSCYLYNSAYFPCKKHCIEVHYPTLFRGGIAFGEVKHQNMLCISNNDVGKSYNVLGKAVVQAVNLEKNFKCNVAGAKIFVSEDFYNELDGEHKKFIFNDENGDRFLLWPAFMVNKGYDADIEWNNHVTNFLNGLVGMMNYYLNNGNKEIASKYLDTIMMSLNSFKVAFELWYKDSFADIVKKIMQFIEKNNLQIGKKYLVLKEKTEDLRNKKNKFYFCKG